jgi:hypothetical protein
MSCIAFFMPNYNRSVGAAQRRDRLLGVVADMLGDVVVVQVCMHYILCVLFVCVSVVNKGRLLWHTLQLIC